MTFDEFLKMSNSVALGVIAGVIVAKQIEDMQKSKIKCMKKSKTKPTLYSDLRDLIIKIPNYKKSVRNLLLLNILRKHDGKIAGDGQRVVDADYIRNIQDQRDEDSELIQVLKSGAIKYDIGKNTTGSILIKDIIQIESVGNKIVLSTYRGKDIELNEKFMFLKNLL